MCLVFYQTLLLAGYLYAHLGRRLGVRRQALLHGVLLALSLALLPVTASVSWKPVGGEPPTVRLLGLLATTVGVPYLLLAATAPLLQDWLARGRAGRSAYRLYAVSNAGSLLALLAYPFVVEPRLPVSRQSVAWSVGYGAFALLCGALALVVARAADAAEPADDARDAGPRPTAGTVGLWLALSGCGSGLLLAVTGHVTQDVASVPLLWVLPLALYLATFIAAFAGWYRRGTWGACLVLALGAMAILWAGGFALPLGVQLGASAFVLVSACMVCHGELARAAPAPARLTAYYTTIAAGGAAGGVLVALAAPALLRDLWELPALLLLAYALLLVVLRREGGVGRVRQAALAAVLALAAAGFVLPTARRDRGTVAADRTFYGVLRVQDAPGGLFADQRVLRVGRIFHGGQFLDPARAAEPTAYFTAGSGVERAIRLHPKRANGQPLRIGVLGLGVGTIAAWGEPGDSIRFYEINPAVETMARAWFGFLDGSAAAVSVVIGDGRLELEREVAVPGGRSRFDVLIVDAFSGDAVPVHLLTREAVRVYDAALAPGGVLAFNVTNRHVDLAPVVRGLAAELGAVALDLPFAPPAGSGGSPSRWILVARDGAGLEAVRPDGTAWSDERVILWTDDASDLLAVLR